MQDKTISCQVGHAFYFQCNTSSRCGLNWADTVWAEHSITVNEFILFRIWPGALQDVAVLMNIIVAIICMYLFYLF